MKMTLHHHPPPPPGTQCQQYLSCYLPDFDQTLKVGYVDSETVPIPSDPPTIETVSEYLDSEYW